MYQIVFAPDVLEELAAIETPMERRKAIAAIQCLCADPSSLGFAKTIDTQGHINRIGVIGGVAFTFWADHAMGRLRITAIQSVVD